MKILIDTDTWAEKLKQFFGGPSPETTTVPPVETVETTSVKQPILRRLLNGFKNLLGKVTRRVIVTSLDIATDGKESKAKRVFNFALFFTGVYFIFSHLTAIIVFSLIFLFLASMVPDHRTTKQCPA